MSLSAHWVPPVGPLAGTVGATMQLLTVLGVRAPASQVASYLTAHPSFPSLVSVVDCLEELGLRSSARRLQASALPGLPTPFLAQVAASRPEEDSAFWVVRSQDAQGLTCIEPGGRRRRLSPAELATRFRGVVLLPGPGPAAVAGRGAALPSHVHQAAGLGPTLARSSAALAALVSAVALLPGRSPELMAAALGHLALAWVGLGASLLLAPGGRAGEAWRGRLCPTRGRFDCAQVARWSAGRLFGVVPLGDLGVAFFAGQLAAGTVAGLAGWERPYLSLALGVNLLLLPFTLWLVALQGLVIRRWCWLCMLVHLALWAQAALGLAAVGLQAGALTAMGLRPPLLLAAVALLAALAYAYLRSLLVAARAALALHQSLEKLRARPGVLATLLAEAAPAATEVPGKLLLGDPLATTEVLLVSHPFCTHCAEAHLELTRLCASAPGLVRGAIVFMVSADDPAAAGAARHLLREGVEATSAWYRRQAEAITRWRARADNASTAPEQQEKLERQRRFGEQQSLGTIPAWFVDGKRLPAGFELRHVRLLLKARQRAGRPPVASAAPEKRL